MCTCASIPVVFTFFPGCIFVGSLCVDPLQGDFPEVIEEYLEHGVIKCVAFNHRGSLLAGINPSQFSFCCFRYLSMRGYRAFFICC